jgi:hypothetical protein
MVSVGFGMGRGSFTEASGVGTQYRSGATPVIRIGRMIGNHSMISVHYGGWVIEYGDVPIKTRRSMQTFGLALALFPGRTGGASGGIYIRAGGGVGWTGETEVEITPDDPQGHGHGHHEYGTGAFAEAGYEFWISRNFTVGAGVCYHYSSINESIFESAWFASGVMNLNLYF